MEKKGLWVAGHDRKNVAADRIRIQCGSRVSCEGQVCGPHSGIHSQLQPLEGEGTGEQVSRAPQRTRYLTQGLLGNRMGGAGIGAEHPPTREAALPPGCSLGSAQCHFCQEI